MAMESPDLTKTGGGQLGGDRQEKVESVDQTLAEQQIEELRQLLPGLEAKFQNVKDPIHLSTIGGDNITVVESYEHPDAGMLSVDDLAELKNFLNRLSRLDFEVVITGQDDILDNAAAKMQREENIRENKPSDVRQKMAVVIGEFVNANHDVHPGQLFTIIRAALNGAIRK